MIVDDSISITVNKDGSKTNNFLETESMDVVPKEVSEKINKVIVINEDVASNHIHRDTYKLFSICFTPLVLMTIMTCSKSRNPIKYNLPFLIKEPYIMCLQNDTSSVELTYNDIKRLNKHGI